MSVPIVVLVILAVIWGLVLVPPVVRARRGREIAVPVVDDRVVVERQGAKWLAPLLLVGGLLLGVDAIVHGDVGGGLVGLTLLALAVLLWRRRHDALLALADHAGLELPGRGRLAWADVECLVPFGSMLEIVARPGVPPIRAGTVQRLMQRIDRAATGYDVWGLLPTVGARPGQADRLVAFVQGQGIEVVKAKPGAARRLLRLIGWFLSP